MGLGDLLARVMAGYLETTPGGGIHLLIRCPEGVGESTELAKTQDGRQPLIETKGEGGFCIVSPSGGLTHPSGRAWSLQHGGFATIATLSRAEWLALQDLARAFDLAPRPVWEPPEGASEPGAGDRPSDRYDVNGDVPAVLLAAGWELLKLSEDGNQHWRSPDADGKHESATWHPGLRRLYVFSSSTPFPEINHGYKPFTVLAILRHGGDFAAAARELLELEINDYVAGFAASNGQGTSGSDIPPGGQDISQAGPSDDQGGNGEGADDGGSGDLLVVTAHTVTPTEVQWLWHGWLPRRKLTTLDGDPDVGKSTMMLDLAARVTTGSAMPDGSSGVRGDVILLAAEDDMDDTIVPRLIVAGADLERVHIITGVKVGQKDEAPFTIPGDVAKLEYLITRRKAVLVIVDVLFEYLDGHVNSYKDAEVRKVAMAPLRQVARRTSASIVMLRHFTKAPDGKALHRGGGSIGIVGAARAGWVLARHPEDEGLRVLAPSKANLTRRTKPLGFRLEPHDSWAKVVWQGEIDTNADQLINQPARTSEDRQEEKTKEQRVIEAIEELLPLGWGNAMLSNEVRELVMDAVGCSKRTYETAHAQVVFGRGWWKTLEDGTKGLMIWRPEPGEA
jgi:hypothetical protein